jgi:hypothetical protein
MNNRRTIGVILAGLIGVASFLLVVLAVGGSGAVTPPSANPTLSSEEAERLILASAIRLEDLPHGWREGGVQKADAPGAHGRFFWFYGTSDQSLDWVNVSETLIVYPSEKEADRAYTGWRDRYIPPDAADKWEQIPELEFQHHAYEMQLACLPGYVNGVSHLACTAVARYRNIITVMLGNVFADRWLTMADFRAVLEAMDTRIVATPEGKSDAHPGASF